LLHIEVVAAHPELEGVHGPPVLPHRCMKHDGDVAIPLNTSSRILVYGSERPPVEPLHLVEEEMDDFLSQQIVSD
jgi:hypothetical protein